jgi:hypothetical protein
MSTSESKLVKLDWCPKKTLDEAGRAKKMTKFVSPGFGDVRH